MRSLLFCLALLTSACGSPPDRSDSTVIVDGSDTEMTEADRRSADKGKRPEPIAADSADPTTATPLAADERRADAPGTGWPGRYEFVEGARGTAYVWTYTLSLAESLAGTLDVDGPQVTTRYAVDGDLDDHGLRVTLAGFRPDNVSTLIEPGEVLFELREGPAGDQGDEAGDRTIWTHWRAMTSTGAEGNEPVQIAFTPVG